MNRQSDPRIKAFGKYVDEAHLLWHQFDRALDDQIQAEEAMRIIANPGKGDDVTSMREFLAKRGGIAVLRGRHVAAKLRCQLHITKGRAIKDACLDAVHELILDSVGGVAGLTDCPIGPLAQHYVGEIRAARAWPPADASPRELNLHLSEVWKSVETAIGESDLIRRERKDPAPWSR